MTDSVVQLRVDSVVKAGWVLAAGREGVSLSEWVRAACGRSAELVPVVVAVSADMITVGAVPRDRAFPKSVGTPLGGVKERVVALQEVLAGRPVFNDRCELRSVHSGGLVCRVCGGVTW